MSAWQVAKRIGLALLLAKFGVLNGAVLWESGLGFWLILLSVGGFYFYLLRITGKAILKVRDGQKIDPTIAAEIREARYARPEESAEDLLSRF